MIKACIFDLDGTLTDTLESLTYSVGLALAEMGLPEITQEQCRSFVGDGARCLIERSLFAVGEPDDRRLEEGMKIYGRIFDKNCTYHVTPYKGIRELLSALKMAEIKLAVLSNKPHRQTMKVVDEMFGENMFERVQGQSDEFKRKPDPAGIDLLLQQMNVKKEQCMYVGDSEVDIHTGKNAQVESVGVTWGFRDGKALKEAGAKHVIDVPSELLNYIV